MGPAERRVVHVSYPLPGSSGDHTRYLALAAGRGPRSPGALRVGRPAACRDIGRGEDWPVAAL